MVHDITVNNISMPVLGGIGIDGISWISGQLVLPASMRLKSV